MVNNPKQVFLGTSAQTILEANLACFRNPEQRASERTREQLL